MKAMTHSLTLYTYHLWLYSNSVILLATELFRAKWQMYVLPAVEFKTLNFQMVLTINIIYFPKQY